VDKTQTQIKVRHRVEGCDAPGVRCRERFPWSNDRTSGYWGLSQQSGLC